MSCYFRLIAIALIFTSCLIHDVKARSTGWLPIVVHDINNSVPLDTPTPALPFKADNFSDGISIEWPPFGNQGYIYTLEYQLVGDSSWQVLYQGENSFVQSNIPLTSGNYNFRIACAGINACPLSGYAFSNVIVQTYPIPSTPAKPNLEVSGTANTLTWQAVDYASRYEVEVSFRRREWTNVATTAFLQKTWTDLEVGNRKYRVRACNNIGCSAVSPESDEITIYPVPLRPSPPVAELIGDDIKLTWSPSQSHDYYNLMFSSREGGRSMVNPYWGSSLLLKNFAPVTEAKWHLQACNDSGCSPWSYQSNVITVDPTPGQVTTPTVEVAGNDVTITWQSEDYAQYYRITYLDNNSLPGGLVSDSATGNSITVRYLGPVLNRRFYMRACNEDRCSEYGSGATDPITILTAPTKPKAILNGETKRVAVSWNTPSDNGDYKIEYNIDGGTWQALSPTVQSNYSQQVSQKGVYKYRVKACLSADVSAQCSSWSEASDDITVILLEPPKNVVAQAINNDMSISWQAVADAHSYSIEVNVDEQGWQPLALSNTAGYIYAPSADGSYKYRIKACTSADVNATCSGWSIASIATSYTMPIRFNDVPAPLTTIEVGQSYSFTPTIENAIGVVTFAIHNKPTWASFNKQSGALTGVATFTDIGTSAPITISASDGVSSGALNAFAITVIDLYSGIIYRDASGNLYLQLPASHQNKRLRVFLENGRWRVEELTAAQWDALNVEENFTVSDFTANYADVNSDSLEDILLFNGQGKLSIVIEQTIASELSYQINAGTAAGKIRAINLELIGTTH